MRVLAYHTSCPWGCVFFGSRCCKFFIQGNWHVTTYLFSCLFFWCKTIFNFKSLETSILCYIASAFSQLFFRIRNFSI